MRLKVLRRTRFINLSNRGVAPSTHSASYTPGTGVQPTFADHQIAVAFELVRTHILEFSEKPSTNILSSGLQHGPATSELVQHTMLNPAKVIVHTLLCPVHFPKSMTRGRVPFILLNGIFRNNVGISSVNNAATRCVTFGEREFTA